MLFEQFVTLLITLKINISVTKAQALYNGTLDILDAQGIAFGENQTYAVIQLREKLTGKSIHDQLVDFAVQSPKIMQLVRESKKMMAIKELKDSTRCGLLEAKNAIEDVRVWGKYPHPLY